MEDGQEPPQGLRKWHWLPVLVTAIPGLFYGIIGHSSEYLGRTAGAAITVLLLTVLSVAAYRKLSLSNWDPMPASGWRVIVGLATLTGVLVGFFYPGMSGAAGYFGSILWLAILGYPIAMLVSAGKYGISRLSESESPD